MHTRVCFHSYFKELTGCADTVLALEAGTTLGALHDRLMRQYPKLAPLRKSTLLAVDVDYQTRDYVLQDGEEVSLFPPVQGG